MRAYPYIRWSTDKQGDGSSDTRQRTRVTDFIEQEGWSIARWLVEDGVSASTGANITVGKLSEFIRECELAEGRDKVLVVDEQDRLSRLHPIDFFEWFPKFLRTGVTVAFVDSEMIVDQNSFRNQRRQMRRIFDDQEEAFRYTERLGRRVRHAWQEMRDNGLPVHCDSTVPGWLKMTRDAKGKRIGFARREDKVAVLDRIFSALADGRESYRSLAKRLTQEGEQTFRRGRCWHHSTIAALAKNRAVLGEYQHKVKRQPIGDPRPNYFPQVISDVLFQRVNDPALVEVLSQRSQGDKFRNLLSNRAVCHECGSRMTLIDRQASKGAASVPYLVCAGYKEEGRCDQVRRIRYLDLEKFVLDTLLTSALDDIYFQNETDLTELSARLAGQRRALEDVGRKLDKLVLLVDNDEEDERLAKRYSALKAEEKAAKVAVEATEAQWKAAKGSASPEAHVRRVSELREDLTHSDVDRRLVARRTVKLALNALIMKVEIRAGKQQIKWSYQTVRRHPDGVPPNLHYVQTEEQDGIIVLKGGIRFIHVNLTHKRVIFDQTTNDEHMRGSQDSAVVAYRRRVKAAAAA